MTWSLAATLLLLSGDVELNPGPKKGAPKDTGPTPEQKIAELETTVKTYEEKISGKKTIMKWSIEHLTLLSLSSSFLSHSKSEYLLRTDDSLTLNTGKLVFIRTS